MKSNLDKLENLEKEAQTVVERIGLKEPEDALLSSSLSSEHSSGSYSQPIEVKLEDFDTRCSLVGSETAEFDVEEEREDSPWEAKHKLADKHAGFLETKWVLRHIERRKTDFDNEVRKYEFTGNDEGVLVEEFEARMVQLQRWLGEEEDRLRDHLL